MYHATSVVDKHVKWMLGGCKLTGEAGNGRSITDIQQMDMDVLKNQYCIEISTNIIVGLAHNLLSGILSTLFVATHKMDCGS